MVDSEKADLLSSIIQQIHDMLHRTAYCQDRLIPVFLMECPYYIDSAKPKWTAGKSAKLSIWRCGLLHTEQENI